MSLGPWGNMDHQFSRTFKSLYIEHIEEKKFYSSFTCLNNMDGIKKNGYKMNAPSCINYRICKIYY